jgi:hypothetical protein
MGDNIKQIKDNNSKVFLDTPTPSEIAKNKLDDEL